MRRMGSFTGGIAGFRSVVIGAVRQEHSCAAGPCWPAKRAALRPLPLHRGARHDVAADGPRARWAGGQAGGSREEYRSQLDVMNRFLRAPSTGTRSAPRWIPGPRADRVDSL